MDGKMTDGVGRPLVRLYLGCGEVWKPGWTNVDVRKPRSFNETEPDTSFVSCDVLDLGSRFAPETVDQIRAEMLIEHIPQSQVPDFLYQCWNVLRPGGRLELLTVDFGAIAKEYHIMHDIEAKYNRSLFESMAHILLNSFAGMRVEDSHKSLQCRSYLQDILESEAFTDIQFRVSGTRHWGLIVSARKGEHVDRSSLRQVDYF